MCMFSDEWVCYISFSRQLPLLHRMTNFCVFPDLEVGRPEREWHLPRISGALTLSGPSTIYVESRRLNISGHIIGLHSSAC